MLSQRIHGLALGYEDINDHEQLRKDPVFGILAGREALDEPLAGKSTLNRMERLRDQVRRSNFPQRRSLGNTTQ
jgi:DDE family transposase